MSSSLRMVNVEEVGGFDWWRGTYAEQTTREIQVIINFDRLADGDNGAIWCEAQVDLDVEGKVQHLIPPTRINLMNSTRASGWKALTSALEDATDMVAWTEPIANAVSRAIDMYRNGDREVELNGQASGGAHPFLLDPYVASAGVSVLFGEGGTGKSLLALGMAASVASGQPIFGKVPHTSGPVVYFDYEDDPVVHAERLEAIVEGMNLELKHPIYHRSLIAKVSQSQASMRRSIQDTGAVMAVLDSIGMGRGGNANTAEDTVRLFRALRSLEVPTLAVDHVTKEDKRAGSMLTPYGSVYTINSARLLWGAVVAEGLSNEQHKYINLSNTKANRVALHPPLAMRISYANEQDQTSRTRWLEAVRFDVYDQWWDDVLPDTWEIVRAHLAEHTAAGWTIVELATTLNLEESAITKALQRHKDELIKEKRGRAFAYSLADTTLHGSEYHENPLSKVVQDGKSLAAQGEMT